jgi:hypothetical protein
MKTAQKRKNGEFLVMPLKHVLSVMGLVNHPETPKLWAIALENGHKHKNDEFLVMSLKHVLSFMGLVNDEFLAMPLKHVLGVMDLVNNTKIPKLWAIVHKNSHKHKNDELFLSFLSKIYRLSYSL